MGASSWTQAERNRNAATAYEAWRRGETFVRIGRVLEVDQRTVARLVREEQERQRVPLAAHALRSIDFYMGIQRDVYFDLERLAKPGKEYIDPTNGARVVLAHDVNNSKVGLYNTAIRAQENIDVITGIRKDPERFDPAKVEVNVNVGASEARTQQADAYDRLLARLDERRSRLDERDARHNPRLALDSDSSNGEATPIRQPPP